MLYGLGLNFRLRSAEKLAPNGQLFGSAPIELTQGFNMLHCGNR
jgi:hypothetical protein